MKSGQLRKALYHHPMTKKIFGGVFARNKIPDIPKDKTVAYIVNTDPAHKPGQHWVAFYITKKTVYYFDSYGLPPKGFRKVMNTRPRKKYFLRRLQGSGYMCGNYCLYFILSRLLRLNFQGFGSDLDANDRFVKLFTEKNFHL